MMRTEKKKTVVTMRCAPVTKRSATQSSTANMTPSYRPPKPEKTNVAEVKKKKELKNKVGPLFSSFSFFFLNIYSQQTYGNQ